MAKDTKKVVLIADSRYEGIEYKAGDEVNVDNRTAEQWTRRGRAHFPGKKPDTGSIEVSGKMTVKGETPEGTAEGDETPEGTKTKGSKKKTTEKPDDSEKR